MCSDHYPTPSLSQVLSLFLPTHFPPFFLYLYNYQVQFVMIIYQSWVCGFH